MEKKFKILRVTELPTEASWELVVDFYYNQKEEVVEHEEESSTNVTFETSQEIIRVPINFTSEQVLEFLRLKYQNTYQPLNDLNRIKNEVKSLLSYAE